MGADADLGQEHLRKSAPSAVKQLSNGKDLSLFFDDLLDAKPREFNPRYAEAEGALLGQFRHLHTNIHGRADHASDRWGSFFLDWFPVRDAWGDGKAVVTGIRDRNLS